MRENEPTLDHFPVIRYPSANTQSPETVGIAVIGDVNLEYRGPTEEFAPIYSGRNPQDDCGCF